MNEFFATSIIVVICSTVQKSSWAEVQATIVAKASKEQETNLKSLLTAFCDAVVHVADDCRIQDDGERLAAMLFRQPAGGTFRGSSFLEVLHEEDRTRFSH